MKHWMFQCEAVSKLVSESMDQKLPLYRRMGIRFHLMMCKFCTRYRKQLYLLREAARNPAKAGESDVVSCRLSDDAKARIKKELHDACIKSSS